jgi:hypothetical protein
MLLPPGRLQVGAKGMRAASTLRRLSGQRTLWSASGSSAGGSASGSLRVKGVEGLGERGKERTG